MAKNKASKQMQDEAREYVDDLPAETAMGRMLDDDGHPMSRPMPNDKHMAPVSESNKAKRGNQPRS